ncbi:S8 family serine peptidase [Leifsonia xyli]|uniref:S8 family serine peptidase n=1 Tax=Leifsonia xyli TaxID=1575 RepID=UPI0009D69AEA|nr:S8 family serine peptidase [Leifsonia xyli]
MRRSRATTNWWGAYAFLDGYRTMYPVGAQDYCSATACSARDSEGHGTHTTTTAVGDYVQDAPLLGTNRGPVSGVAPGASVIAYRALGPNGGIASDIVAAVQQAILDGVDVINYSVGGDNTTYLSPVGLAFLDAYAAGISVNAAAGNSGPDASTVGNMSPWMTSVGASTLDKKVHLDGDPDRCRRRLLPQGGCDAHAGCHAESGSSGLRGFGL